MNVGNRIKLRREQLGLSADELASLINKNRATVYRYENGDIESLPTTILEPLAKALKTTPQYLMGWSDDPSQMQESNFEYDNIFKIEKKEFPLLGAIACGEPIYADENRESYIMAGTDIKADFCLICKGDSMINARIYDGDIVFIKKQDIVNNGEIAAVIIDNEATLKRFYYYREADLLILKAENPRFKDLEYRGEELNQIRVLGKAVAFQGDVI